MRLTILMPCLDEAATLGECIRKANAWCATSGLECEILVADNGSTDGSQAIAESLGARVVPVARRGYGSALFHGCVAARGDWIILGDADDSYDFSRLDPFAQKLREGFELVMGNRFQGGIAPGAMPWKNRYLGNPVLSWLGRLFFACPVGDFHCGLRALSRAAFLRMDLRTTGMEFASEMVIKASLLGMRIAEVPTTLAPDGRRRPPHLRPWSDGWRHLRFMLLFSPGWLFFVPGTILFGVSLVSYLALLLGPVRIGSVTFDLHTLFFAETGLILGLLAAAFSVLIRAIAAREGLLREPEPLRRLREGPVLEIGSLAGASMMALGALMGLRTLFAWGSQHFGELAPGSLLRTISFATTLILLGGTTLVVSLAMGFLALPTRSGRD